MTSKGAGPSPEGKAAPEVTLTTAPGETWRVRINALTSIKDGKVAIIKVKKHGHKGSPHTRLLCFDYQHKCLYWVKSEGRDRQLTHQESKNVDVMAKSISTITKSISSITSVDDLEEASSGGKTLKGQFIRLHNVIDLVSGKKTKILQRLSARRSDVKNTFSIICLERTLDIEARNEETARHIKTQLQDFYYQYMGFPLLSSEPDKMLGYDPQKYKALSDKLYDLVNEMYRESENRWQQYMWESAAEKIVKDYPRLAKNMRVWEKEENKPPKRIDLEERKQGWGENVLAVMQALCTMMAEKKRGKEIMDNLQHAVNQVEKEGKDRQHAMAHFFNTTFTKNHFEDDSRRESFRNYYVSPEFLSILKVCNQFVLIPASTIIKKDCLETYRTKDYKPHGWAINIEFQKTQVLVHQQKRDVSVDELFDFQYRLTFVFPKPVRQLTSVSLSIDFINFATKCPPNTRHDVFTRLMMLQRIGKVLGFSPAFAPPSLRGSDPATYVDLGPAPKAVA